MNRLIFCFTLLLAHTAICRYAVCTPMEAPSEATPTPAVTPVVIEIDDNSTYSACQGEVSSVVFSCECDAKPSRIKRLTKRQRAQLRKASRRNKKNFDACLGKGLFEDTQAGGSCGNPEGLRSWCERYHSGQQNCCAAECAENQARYCCDRHCGRGKFKTK
jgi:hypothetical protein